MGDGLLIYPFLILMVAFVSIVSGFRKGFTRQISSLLGFGFGAVAARVLTPMFSPSFQWATSFSQAEEFHEITVNLVCGAAIYAAVYLMFAVTSPLMRLLLSAIRVGMFNRIAGGFFSLLKNLLWLSIAMNLLLCLMPQSGLLRFQRAGDGNLVAAVMALTPGILGCYGGEDFAHFHQLKEAKTISCNFRTRGNVIMIPDTTYSIS